MIIVTTLLLLLQSLQGVSTHTQPQNILVSLFHLIKTVPITHTLLLELIIFMIFSQWQLIMLLNQNFILIYSAAASVVYTYLEFRSKKAPNPPKVITAHPKATDSTDAHQQPGSKA